MTDCITEYIRFCEDTTVPARTVHCFSNNKPWITRDLKALLNKKKMAFRAGDREEQRRVQHELRDMLRTCKDNYRRKLEAKLQQNNPPYDTSGPPFYTPTLSQMARPTPSSLLYNTSPSAPPPSPPPPPSSTEDIHINPCPTVTTGQTCASQLSPVLGHLYNLSLSQEKVPMLWKTSCLVPVPKKSRPSDPADYRPVALTSHVMKVLERLVLAQLRPQVRKFLDPLQFAYQPHLGVDDAVIYLLQRAHMHLDGGGGTVRITFFDFSSAFNTIQPLLLGEKLQVMGVDDSMISWITDYLTGRPQFVRLGSVLSDVVVSDTGAPQGTVLSPFLFTLYTTDFQYNSESCHLQKFSDDSAVNHLRLNVNKTREMVIDFRRKKMPSQPLLRIRGEVVEEVEDYKYLGVVIDNRLDWKSN
ncbi:hypothetical protein L3Q82_003877 [Scortum barcoo]|uniref:Uncharacterized protein n=1 Tax=Scortum barcoo TaxID=214431 RepID=A0ACB8X6Q5_9TELE|nr:hypothetical protein L3Q82_003877 [Scortum barcoo]